MSIDLSMETEIPARKIPTPAHLSPEARASFTLPPPMSMPPAEDKDGWRALVTQMDAHMLAMVGPYAATIPAHVEDLMIGDAPVYAITPPGVEEDDPRVLIELHGGGMVMGGGEFCRANGIMTAAAMGARTWSVDYRLPPTHPYPAALDDCVAAYRALLEIREPRHIIVTGASGGGNLAAAMILRARDEGLPLPAAVVLDTPEVDLTESGDSFTTNLGLDSVLRESLMPSILLYADGHSLTDPYLSPLFGDFSKGFPPTFLTTGTRDLFLSNTVRMHAALRAADIDADLYVMEAASHTGFPGSPERADRDKELHRFLKKHWG